MEQLLLILGGLAATMLLPKTKPETGLANPMDGMVATTKGLMPDGNNFMGKVDNTDFRDPAAAATSAMIDSFAETFDQDANTIERNATDNFRGNQTSRFSQNNLDMESSINFDSLLDQMAPNPGDDMVVSEPEMLPTPKTCGPGEELVQVQCFLPPCDPVCQPIGGLQIGGGSTNSSTEVEYYPDSAGAQRSIPASERTPFSTPLLNWDARTLGDRLNQIMKDQGRTLSEARAQNQSAIRQGADLNADGFVTNREWYNFTNE